MSNAVESLILDLLDWIGPSPRPYSEVIEAWRTSCPRLAIWEEANERGFVRPHYEHGRPLMIAVTPSGAAHLKRYRS